VGCDGCGEGLKIGLRIGGVVDARAAVKAAVDWLTPATGLGCLRHSCRISRCAGNSKGMQEMTCLGGEPGRMTRLKDDKPLMEIAKHREEDFGDVTVEDGRWWKLKQDEAQFLIKGSGFGKEDL